MNKDLDFIKRKLAESKVKAPDDMDESFVTDLLCSESYVPDAQPVIDGFETESRKLSLHKKRRAFAAVAAAVVLIGALSIALTTHFNSDPKTITLPGGLPLRQFRNSIEVMSAVNEIRESKGLVNIADYLYDNRGYTGYLNESSRSGGSSDNDSSANVGTNPNLSSGNGGSSAESHYSETYKQVDGVDEADIIKTDGRYIYCVDYSDSIAIFSAEGESSRKLAELKPGQTTASTPDEAKSNEAESNNSDDYAIYRHDTPYMYQQDVPMIQELYVLDERLIVICVEANYSKENFNESTEVFVYDVSDINKILLLDSMTQSGYYSSSRMIGDTLYTVSDYMTLGYGALPVCGGGSTPDEIPADCIYSLYEPDDDSFLVLSAYDTLDYTAQTKSKAILGKVEDIYCNENNMYAYSTVWEEEEESDYENRYTGKEMTKSHILKISLNDGISFTAYAEINGRINDQYSMDEKDGYLRVATQSYRNYSYSANIIVLDSTLNTVGTAVNIAWGEYLEAARFVGDTAYIITYRNTDPLFVIDLSDPTSPTVLGEAQITGYSSMLVPIDDSTVLGLGYHIESSGMSSENGFKIALFDVSNKTAPKVLDSKSYVNYGSAVTEEPKALVYNPERGDYIIPLNFADYGRWVYDEEEDAYDFKENTSHHGGILNFSVEDGKIVEKELYAADFDAVDRCVYVGDYIYMTYYTNDGLNVISEKYK